MVQMSYRNRVLARGGTVEPLVVRNRYAGVCSCGAKVSAGAGVATQIDHTWRIKCTRCSEPALASAANAEIKAAVGEGQEFQP